MTTESGTAKLLVNSALEAVLAKSVSRLDAESRGERIKAAALMECADKGYPRLTIANIAKRAKVSTSTIYADYPDRDKLLVAAMEMLFALLATDVIETPKTDDPQERVEQLLIAHGQVYAQPLTTWITRLHVTLAWAGHNHLREIGQQVFRGIDAFWVKFLRELEDQGHLKAIEPDLVVPLILGPVERCTIISRLGCGEEDPHRPSLEAVARDTAAALFRLWGSRARAVVSIGANETAHVSNYSEGKVSSETHDLGALDAQDGGPKTARTAPSGQKAGILHAAKALCSEHGYEAASVRDIAARAGVSTATLYEHFTDKTNLFRTALESEFAIRGAFRHDHMSLPLDAALTQIASRAADTEWAWMYNVLMTSSISDDPGIVSIGRKNRDATEDFLASVLPGKPTALMLNFLLGGIERSGVLALILFGSPSVDLSYLARLAAFTARCHEALNRP